MKTQEIAKHLPSVVMSTIFDIGANVGKTAAKYRATFPNADIYSFEPVSSTFEELAKRMSGKQIKCYNLALSSKSGVASIMSKPFSLNNRIVSPKAGETETVKTVTGDEFCSGIKIRHINYVKVDTEGHDLKVVLGFSDMLRGNAIDLMELEVGLNSINKLHVPLDSAVSAMRFFGYEIFSFGDIAYERQGRPVLRRANVTFVSGRLATAT